MLSQVRQVTRRADDGASAVEYGLLFTAIAALLIIVAFAFMGLVQDVFSDDCTDPGTSSTAPAKGCG